MLASHADIEHLLPKLGSRGWLVALECAGGSVLVAAAAGDVVFPIGCGQSVLADFSESVVSYEWFAKEQEDYSLIGVRRDILRSTTGQLFRTENVDARNGTRQRYLSRGKAAADIAGNPFVFFHCSTALFLRHITSTERTKPFSRTESSANVVD